MSIDFVSRKKIPYDDIIAGKVNGISISEVVEPKKDLKDICCLGNGRNYLFAYRTHDGGTSFSAYGRNDPCSIIHTLEGFFDTEIISEYHDDFWTVVGESYQEEFTLVQLSDIEENS